ncbi:hypothetical protein OAB11_02190 [Verrucomicrobia bacterium]|nr:hypothetical protein [Verrucomicrobiota bacterium]
MFLQFFVWGAWFTTLGTVLTAQDMSGVIGAAYGAVPMAAIIAPLFLGLIADRFFNCEKTMGILHLIGGALLFAGPSLIANKQGDTLSYIILANMLCYMPTLGLSNTVAFTNIKDRNDFPALRVKVRTKSQTVITGVVDNAILITKDPCCSRAKLRTEVSGNTVFNTIEQGRKTSSPALVVIVKIISVTSHETVGATQLGSKVDMGTIVNGVHI